ncbi:receptor-like protein 13 [Quercus suber]|uniref:Receptor-like protein 13 n=1 Tax=Quercus suber TaxID=58331 RepID=A0AAW0LJ87_QUESU
MDSTFSTSSKSLSRLGNLETLNLADNGFNKSFIKSLSAIKSLKNLNLKLSALENLEKLDLSSNLLNGSITTQEWNYMSKLSKLMHIDLSWNVFEKDILRFLGGALPDLKSVDLSHNEMQGPLSSKDMTNFSSLEILDISGNGFTGILSSYIGALPSLKAISLSQNKLNGTLQLHTKDLGMLKKLEELDLSDNNFEGILPPCLRRLTSLRFLDISKNQFSGNVPSFVIANLTSLEYIDLSYNRFEGLFSFSSLANHSKLEVVRFKGENYRVEEDNKLVSESNKLVIETENPSWEPSFQLKVLLLPNCNLNNFSSNVPKFLFYQRELELVDISHNRLKGSFPNWLIENNTKSSGQLFWGSI